MLSPLPDWPLFGYSDDVRPALQAARAAGLPSALVTLHRVEGGGPRPPGTQMLFAEGIVSGFLSGGCVESDVALHATETLKDGLPRRLVYGEGGPWPDIRLLCGARIELLVERIDPDDHAVSALLELTARRRPALWRSDGLRRQLTEQAGHAPLRIHGGASFEVRRVYAPVPRLAVVGSDPTALAIAQLGAQAGFETHLIRPRGPSEPPPIPGIAYRRDEPGEALAEMGLDGWTAVAVATHDWDVDQAALMAALPSQAAYVGVLGARRRLPERLMRLKAAGVGDEALARLKAPIGLDLGGKAPWEVAVAVIAEIVATRDRVD
jgi:xanthine dehydrogenase accessory factor